MNRSIRRVFEWLDNHQFAQQWLWFIFLWCGGLASAMALAYPIKWLIKVAA